MFKCLPKGSEDLKRVKDQPGTKCIIYTERRHRWFVVIFQLERLKLSEYIRGRGGEKLTGLACDVRCSLLRSTHSGTFPHEV